MRYDLSLIASWIEPGATVLDLGCGAGDLLHILDGLPIKTCAARASSARREKSPGASKRASRSCTATSSKRWPHLDYPDGHFDYVILSQTLQQVFEPAVLIREMLRVGRCGIVSSPNFAYYRIRVGKLSFFAAAPRCRGNCLMSGTTRPTSG